MATARTAARLSIVAGPEHVAGVQRERNLPAARTLANGVELGPIGREDEDGLGEQRQVLAAVCIAIGLTDRRGAGVRGDPAHEERRHVQGPPGGQVVPHHDGDLGVEVGHGHGHTMPGRATDVLRVVAVWPAQRVTARPGESSSGRGVGAAAGDVRLESVTRSQEHLTSRAPRQVGSRSPVRDGAPVR